MNEGPAECNIKVICRVRPLNDAEERAGSKFILKFLSDEAVSVGGKNFTYDRVYKPDVTQEEVYITVAKPIVKDVLSGYNGTIFAYGQTASGKTHTMEGEIGNSMMSGIIPRIIGDIFGYIYQMNENIEFHIKVSYFEIYMDKIRDLLDSKKPLQNSNYASKLCLRTFATACDILLYSNPNVTQTNLSVHEDKNRVPYVKGATERFVASPEEVMEVIEEGKANRHVAVTNMNEHSSRSHSVFLINVKQVNIETEKKLSGKLYLVDLAGSEKVSKTGAEGSVLDEAKNINKSLSALGNVIAALADNAGFVPYRDSKLTRILQESLGGNARTTMIICCSPASFNETETKSTLLFGSRAKTIKNSVMINEELTAEEWKRRYEKERDKNSKLRFALERCQSELARWRTGESVPEDERLDIKEEVSTPSSLLDKYVKSGNSGIFALESERTRLEEEKNKLYQQLDDKDEELSAQVELVEKMREQIVEAEDQIRSLVRERDGLISEVSRLQSEKESSNTEIKEVFQALSELAQNYDQKLSESMKRKEENEALMEELEKNKEIVKLLQMDIEQAKETMSNFKKRIAEINVFTSRDIIEIAALLGPDVKMELYKNFEKQEDDGSMLRLMFTKLKSEVKMIVQKCSQLDVKLLEANKKFESSEKDLTYSRFVIQQLEAKMKSLLESLRDMEGKKRLLEAQIDDLNETCSQLKTKEKMYMVQLEDLEKKEHEVASTTQMKIALEKQMELHHKQHQMQISELRNDISEKEKLIGTHTQQSDELKITFNALQCEFEALKAEEVKKTAELKELKWNLEKRDEAAKDLRGLEETVAKDLQILHNLRKLFIVDLEDKVKKIQVNQDDDEANFNTSVQKQKISFLESNLDQLTKVHKQLVRDNADLRCELPKLEKRLKATMDRIRALETALKEAKEGALKDRKRYQQEIDRIKEAVRQKTLLRRGHSATIVKPIRAGHAPPSYAGGLSSNRSNANEINKV